MLPLYREIPRYAPKLFSLFSYNAYNNIEYIGYAESGTVTSASAWYIEKFTYDAKKNVSSIKTASWPSIWDNRASLTYT